MRVLFVTPYFFPATEYGGAVTFSFELLLRVAELGVEVHVLTTNANGSGRLRAGHTLVAPRLEVTYGRVHVGEVLSLEVLANLPGVSARSDLVHVWGTSSPYAVPAAFVTSMLRRPLILSPGGMLSAAAMRRRPFKKKLQLALLRAGGAAGAAFHVTSDQEKSDVLRFFPTSTIHLIPHGVEPKPPGTPHEGQAFLLYLGRLHPFKRVDWIIDAFAQVMRGGSRLVIAGTGERAYVEGLMQRARDLSVERYVEFVGHVDGKVKEDLLGAALGVVLASQSENFGLAIAESLAAGTPCVVTENLPWRSLEEMGCGFLVPESVVGLAAGMRRVLDLTVSDRAKLSEKARSFVKAQFSWPSIAEHTVLMYQKVVAARG